MIPIKDYLGDSVYATWDGYGILLTTENGYPDGPRNKIFMEPEVLRSLENFVGRIKQIVKEQNEH